MIHYQVQVISGEEVSVLLRTFEHERQPFLDQRRQDLVRQRYPRLHLEDLGVPDETYASHMLSTLKDSLSVFESCAGQLAAGSVTVVEVISAAAVLQVLA